MKLSSILVLTLAAASSACGYTTRSPTPWESPVRMDSAIIDVIRRDSTYFVLLRGWGRVDTVSVQITGAADDASVFRPGTGPLDSMTASFGRGRRGWMRVEPTHTTVTGFALSTEIRERRLPRIEEFPDPAIRSDVSGSSATVRDIVELQLSSRRIASESTPRNENIYVVTWFVEEPQRGRRHVEVSFRLQIAPHPTNRNCSRVYVSWLRDTRGEKEENWTRESTMGHAPDYLGQIRSWFDGRACR